MSHLSVSSRKPAMVSLWCSAVLGVSAISVLSGCVVRVAEPLPLPPPPPVTYSPPPPPPPPASAPVYAPSEEQGDIQASEPPPPLPEYDQPPCPDEGYLWTPGYWAFGPGGYYWIPGTWVSPPRVGLLWTPGYWGFAGAVYVFHAGYWGPHVGFYGGVNYGFGYGGVGFAGGRWVGNSFAYNRTITNINVNVVHNVYNETVVNNVNVNRISYNGGPAGVHAAASVQERQWAQEPHVASTPVQMQHFHEAAGNPALFAKANGGHPAIAATPRAAAFNAPGVIGARGAVASPPRPATFNTPGNANTLTNGRPANNFSRPPTPNYPQSQINQPRPPNSPSVPTIAHPPAPAPQVHQQLNNVNRAPTTPPKQPPAKAPPKYPPEKKNPQ
jgi:hypothetical protein